MNRIFTCILGSVAILTWSSCKHKENQNAAPPATPVSIADVKTADAVYYDSYQGLVVALNSVELRSQVPGFITGIFFKEGEVVTKGKPLYEIDRRKYQAAYQQAQANLMSAKASLTRSQKDADRYGQLLKQDAVARQVVDNATATLETSKSQVASAAAALASAKTDLDYSIIRAPFTGRIGISQVKLGAQISQGSTLLNTISSEDPIAVDIVVNEQSIARFAKLQKQGMSKKDSTFKLQIDNGNMYPHQGRIATIDRGVDNQTGTIKVRIQFPNPNRYLKDGMSGVIKVLNDESGNRIVIPFKAVTEQMGEYFVFLAQDTIAKQIKITTGPRVGDGIIVTKGLEAGQKIVTEGFQRLRDGGKITLGDPNQQPAAEGDKKGAAPQTSAAPQNSQEGSKK